MTKALLVLTASALLFLVIGAGKLTLVLTVLALLLGLFLAGKWAFWPRHELPSHRVRHLKMRLFCRLHPGRGHATVAELQRHWSSRASAEKDRYARP